MALTIEVDGHKLPLSQSADNMARQDEIKRAMYEGGLVTFELDDGATLLLNGGRVGSVVIRRDDVQ